MFRQRHHSTSTSRQKRYLLDIIASDSLDASNGIAKATATNRSGNWYKWCTFPKHSVIADKFLGGYPTRADDNPCVIIRRLSAKKPVWNNQETNIPTWNYQVWHIGCICVLPDAPSKKSDPRVLKSNILTLTETTKGLENAGHNNSHQALIMIKIDNYINKLYEAWHWSFIVKPDIERSQW